MVKATWASWTLSPWIFKARDLWGLKPQVLVLKVGVLDVEFKPFTSQRETPGSEFPAVEGCSSVDGLTLTLPSSLSDLL